MLAWGTRGYRILQTLYLWAGFSEQFSIVHFLQNCFYWALQNSFMKNFLKFVEENGVQCWLECSSGLIMMVYLILAVLSPVSPFLNPSKKKKSLKRGTQAHRSITLFMENPLWRERCFFIEHTISFFGCILNSPWLSAVHSAAHGCSAYKYMILTSMSYDYLNK